MSDEDIKIIENFLNYNKEKYLSGIEIASISQLLKAYREQQKLIDIFIHNEAVREGKDFNEIKEKYYECL